MKVTTTQATRHFDPVIITITAETMTELRALERITSLNVSIPHLVAIEEIPGTIVRDMLDALHDVIIKAKRQAEK